jgi:hypothetical protein
MEKNFMLKQKVLAGISLVAALLLNSPANSFASIAKKKKEATFKVRIENVSDKDGLTAADGSRYPFAISPGVYVISEGKMDIFKEGKKAGPELEAQAEDGDPSLLSKKLAIKVGSINLGIFNTPVGGEMPSPLLPGNAFEFTFTATEGSKLNLVTMFGQSNDLFYGPETGIDLFPNGEALNGDVTGLFKLWDAGTEVNQAPGIGADQAPRQKAKNTGAVENVPVHLVKDGFNYPNSTDVLKITISAQ